MSKEEQLKYDNIFDAITDDADLAAEMKRKADRMIVARDAAWVNIIDDNVFVWFENLSGDEQEIVRGLFNCAWHRGQAFELKETRKIDKEG